MIDFGPAEVPLTLLIRYYTCGVRDFSDFGVGVWGETLGLEFVFSFFCIWGQSLAYLSGIMGEPKHKDYIGIILPQKVKGYLVCYSARVQG